MMVSLEKDARLVRAVRTAKDLGERFDDRVELRPGNCNNRDGRCDCLSGTRRPLVNLTSREIHKRRWH